MTSNENEVVKATARRAVERLRREGFEALWAGGCVRDMLLGRTPKDYDIATNARPEQIATLFPGSELVGKAFGVVVAPLDNTHFEIATFREDHGYSDGRHPDAVTFTDARTDATRRDFTVNAVFYDPIGEQYIDFVNGFADARARLIRCVGDPEARFREDYLRILRAARFAAVLGFDIEPNTAAAMRANVTSLSGISAERVGQEFTRTLLEAPKAGQALRLLDDFGILETILPEVTRMKGQEQPPEFHPEGDVFTHTVMMLDMLDTRDPALLYAVLLHDVAKPLTARQDNGRIRFDGHASLGADLAQQVMRRLRLPNQTIEDAAHGIHDHMRFIDVPRMRRSTLRRLVGAPTFPLELELHRLDCMASHSDLANYRLLENFREEMANEPVLPPPWVRGEDVMRLGIAEGPQVGTWLRRAYDAQLEEQFADRETLLAWLETEIRSEDLTSSPS